MKLPLSEKKDFCVFACLERILQKKGQIISQAEISRSFPEYPLRGYHFRQDLLSKFLKNFGLSSEHYNPYTSQTELDLFLRDNILPENDILVAYNYKRLFNSSRNEEQAEHASLVLEYRPIKDIIILAEPSEQKIIEVRYSDMMKSVHPDQNPDYGFYVIN
jgi:hypothetical protein